MLLKSIVGIVVVACVGGLVAVAARDTSPTVDTESEALVRAPGVEAPAVSASQTYTRPRLARSVAGAPKIESDVTRMKREARDHVREGLVRWRGEYSVADGAYEKAVEIMTLARTRYREDIRTADPRDGDVAGETYELVLNGEEVKASMEVALAEVLTTEQIAGLDDEIGYDLLLLVELP